MPLLRRSFLRFWADTAQILGMIVGGTYEGWPVNVASRPPPPTRPAVWSISVTPGRIRRQPLSESVGVSGIQQVTMRELSASAR